MGYKLSAVRILNYRIRDIFSVKELHVLTHLRTDAVTPF